MDQAELILNWMSGNHFQHYRFDTSKAVDRCVEVLFGKEHNNLCMEAVYFKERSEVFRECQSSDYYKVFYNKYKDLCRRSEEIRDRALSLILILQIFVINVDHRHDTDRKKEAFATIVHCLDYAVSNGIKINHLHISHSIINLIAMFDEEFPAHNLYDDVRTMLLSYPPISDEALVGWMIRLAGVSASPDLPQRLVKHIAASK